MLSLRYEPARGCQGYGHLQGHDTRWEGTRLRLRWKENRDHARVSCTQKATHRGGRILQSDTEEGHAVRNTKIVPGLLLRRGRRRMNTRYWTPCYDYPDDIERRNADHGGQGLEGTFEWKAAWDSRGRWESSVALVSSQAPHHLPHDGCHRAVEDKDEDMAR